MTGEWREAFEFILIDHKRGSSGKRELLLHQLVHVAQCERSGGLESFVGEYLSDRRTSPDFSVGSLEDEARGLAREICAGETTEQLA